MPHATWVNGEPGDTVAALDRGLAFGDGVFRTMRCAAGRPLNWRWHYRRLAADCATLALAVPPADLLLAEVARAAPGEAGAKIILTRGASGRGYAITAGSPETRIVSGFALPDRPAGLSESGVRVRRCRLVLSEQPRYAGAKTLNRLENVLARSEWDDRGIHEGLLCDSAGRVVEGTMSNVFVVHRGAVATPALSRCGVVGAQRERLREKLAQAGVACDVRDIAWSELEAADEIFLTNSLIGVWPVARLEARSLAPGPVARLAAQLIAADDADP